MNDSFQSQPPDTSALPPQFTDDSNALKSDCYDEFLDALDLLYIRANLSGRLKFLEAWPKAADAIFGEELIGFDREGATDFERRAVLEEEAEERRVALLETAQTLEENSVEKNVLQTEYVESLVKELGRDIALLLYADKIVSRFIPSPVGVEAAGVVASEVVSSAAPRPSDIPDEFADAPPLAPSVTDIADDESLDAVQPISLDPVPKGSPGNADIPAVEEPAQAASKPAQTAPPSLPEDDYEEPQTLEEAMNELAAKKAAEEAAKAEAAGLVRPPAEATSEQPAVAPDPLSAPSQDVLAPAPPDIRGNSTAQDMSNDESTPEAAAAIQPEPEAPRIQPSAPDTVSVRPRGGPPPPSDPTVQDVSAQARHKALDEVAPIASQKMTFVPSKRPADAAKPQGIPVVGEKKDDDGA